MTTGIPGSAIWIRFPRFIGDSIMIHQAMEPLRQAGFPLVGWGPAPVVELFEGMAGYAAMLADPPIRQGAWDMSRSLRAHHPKGTINLARSQRANLAALLAGVPLRIGWREGLGGLLCNRSLPFKSLAGHQQLRYAALVRSAMPGLGEPPCRPFQPRPNAQAAADALLADVTKPFIVFSLGAMSTSKRLGIEVWTGLGERLLREDHRIVLLGSTVDDQVVAQAISSRLGSGYDLTGKAPLSVAAGVIRRAAGLVGNDSALSHLGAACAVPTVVAFGPTDPALTAPWGNGVRVVRHPSLDCLVCQEGACPRPGHPCMEELPLEALMGALRELGIRKP